MVTKIGASQVGFFGLNGARVILGLTVLIIVDGFFSFNVVDSLLTSGLPGTILALFFGLIIASANLLGIMISQFLDKLIVYYLKRVNNKRLIQFRKNIEQNNDNKFPDASLYRLYFDGDTWNDRNLLPYKQEVMTRWNLIFALVLIGFAMFLKESNEQRESCATGFSQFLSNYALAIFLGTFISLNVLLFSLKLITEREWKDVIIEWVKQLLLISSVIMYPLIYLITQTQFYPNSPAIISILTILLITLIHLLSYSIHLWRNTDNKFMNKIIEGWWYFLGLLMVILVSLLILPRIIKWFFDSQSTLIPVLILVMFIYSSLFQIVKQFRQRTAKEDGSKENEQRIFGIQTRKKVTQWYNLIVTYYELFFHEVKYKALSRLEAYQLVINGVYAYQLIYQYFVKSTENRKKGDEKNRGIVEIDEKNLEYIEYFYGFIKSVRDELNREKLELAMHFYTSLKEAILVYFVSSPFLDVKENDLANRTIVYVIQSEFAGDLIKNISSAKNLKSLYGSILNENISEKVILAFLQNQNIYEDLLNDIVKKYCKKVKMIAKESKKPKVLEKLCLVKNANILFMVVRNKETPLENLEKIAKESKELKILKELAKNENFEVRRGLFYNTAIMQEIHEKLNKDKSFRQKIAADENAPPEVLEALGNDEDFEVRWAVARNKTTPQEILEKLGNDEDFEIRWAVLENPSTPLEIIKKLSSDKNESVRWVVAGNTSTPPEILKELAGDKSFEVRWGVAENTSTPPEILKELAKDEDLEVRWGVAGNTSTPPEILKELAKDEDLEVRRGVAGNTSTPPEILKELAKDEEFEVRRGVAGNTSTPPEILKELAKDEEFEIRWGVAENTSTPPEILEKLSDDEDFEIRRRVVKNTSTPPDIIQKLSKYKELLRDR